MADELDNSDTIDPMEIYTLDDFLYEENIIDELFGDVAMNLKALSEIVQKEASSSRSGPRKYIKRPREQYHQLLMDDYFSENPLYPSKIFRRRFRMSRPLFLRIVKALGEWSPYFTARVDALNRQGLSPLQKCTAAIRQLANGSAADQLDEYLKIGETTAIECMKQFAEGVIAIFGGQYLRRPTVNDVERLLKIGEESGFPGMLGSIDCILRRPARLFDRGDLQKIMLACIILHNMIVEDEKIEDIEENLDLNETPRTSVVQQPEFSHEQCPEFSRVLEINSNIQARPTHVQLKNDLIEHIWQKFGTNRM